MSIRRMLGVAVLAAALTGCAAKTSETADAGRSDATGDAGTTSDVAPDTSPTPDWANPSDASDSVAISKLAAVESLTSVLAYNVSWTTSVATPTELDVRCDGLDPWTITGDAARTDHQVYVMGLVTGASCTFEAKASTPGGARLSATRCGPMRSKASNRMGAALT